MESLSAEDANLTMIPSGFWDVVKKMFTSGSMHWKCLEHWQVIMPNDGPHCLRYLPLQEDGRMAVFLRQDGVWKEAVTESVGSYLAFRTEGAQVEVAVVTEIARLVGMGAPGGSCGRADRPDVVRRKKRPMPGKKDGDGADRSKEPDGSKNKGKRLTVLAVILLAALLIGAVTVFAFRSGAVTDMRAYRLLQDLAWDEEFSVALQVDGDYDGQEFEVSAQIHRMQVEGQAVTLVSRNGNDFYYCGDVLVLENGKAYQIQGENRGSDELLDQTLELYRNFEIREEEGNFFITASGDHAARIVKILLPELEELATEVRALEVGLYTENQKLAYIRFQTEGTAGGRDFTMDACLKPCGGPEEIPDLIRQQIVSGDAATTIASEDILMLMKAWNSLDIRRDIHADLTIYADCGPVKVKEQVDAYRGFLEQTQVYAVEKNDYALYFTDDRILDKNGDSVPVEQAQLANTKKLLDLAYSLCMHGDVTMHDGVYTVSLDEDGMRQAASVIAPETEQMDILFGTGQLRIELENGEIQAIRFELDGSVKVVVAEVPVKLSLDFVFLEDNQKVMFPQAVREALKQEQSK